MTGERSAYVDLQHPDWTALEQAQVGEKGGRRKRGPGAAMIAAVRRLKSQFTCVEAIVGYDDAKRYVYDEKDTFEGGV